MHFEECLLKYVSSGFFRGLRFFLGGRATLQGVCNREVWQRIGTAVAQTLLVFAPRLRSAYRGTFPHLRKCAPRGWRARRAEAGPKSSVES